ncbi:hypothetical protein NMG60_11022350 [Bertholletia excelsa]
MRKCELCNSVARMYCDSDRASLCWDCDARVHAANFLVAKHSRTLLCHVCQAPTPWTGSGPKLGPTVSVCENCIHASNGENNGGEEVDVDSNSEDDGDGGDGDEDDGDNQVVPLSLATPLVSGSSGSEEFSGGSRTGEEAEPRSAAGFSAKRTHEIADIFSDGPEEQQEKRDWKMGSSSSPWQ